MVDYSAQSVNRQVDKMTRPFEAWEQAGFTADLLPIIPVGAALTDNTRLMPHDIGKVPGLLYEGGRWGGFPGWQTVEAEPARVAYWGQLAAQYGAGVGLQARRWPAVDIDVMDATMSANLGVLAEAILGTAPERIGRAPKRLLVYRLADGAEPIKKRRVEFYLPGDDTKHAVEVLGRGQQYVVQGTHPGTGQPYAWTGGKSPTTMGPAALAPVTAERIDRYMDEVGRLVESVGGTVHTRTRGGDDDDRTGVDQGGLAGEPDRVREALEAMGNTCSYDEWITMCAAIKAALGGDEAHYQVYEDWCLAYPGNTPEQARKKWDSLHPPFKLGADYVFRKAAETGWAGYAQAVFTALSDAGSMVGDDSWDVGLRYPGPGVQDPDPEWLREWVYVEQQRQFFHVPTGELIDEDVFERRFAAPGAGVGTRTNPRKRYFESPLRRLARGLVYKPGAARLPVIDGARWVNGWTEASAVTAARTSGRVVTDQDVAPWLTHMEKVIPDPRVRALFLDWMAYVVKHPQEKPNWALFLGGAQGIGKGLLFAPMRAAVGPQNYRSPTPDVIADKWSDWVTEARLVVVEEMRNFDTGTVMNRLKAFITRPPETIAVVKKNKPIYEVDNTAAFVFMSNFPDALSLEKDDRRYLVYWSPMEPEAPAYYDTLGTWLNTGGRDGVVAWLLARDVSAFGPVALGRAPMTAAKSDMVAASGPDAVRIVAELIETRAAPFASDIANPREAWDYLSRSLPAGVRLTLRHVEEGMRRSGGGPLPAPNGGAGARVIRGRRPTPTGTESAAVRVWACRDLVRWSREQTAVVIREYELGTGVVDNGCGPDLSVVTGGVALASPAEAL